VQFTGNTSNFKARDEYRCVTGKSVAIFAVAVEPPSAREAIENNCGEIKKLTSPQCKKTIRLTPQEHQHDVLSGYQTRVLILAKSIEVVPAAPVTTKGKGKRR
jgi:hypothetical protein